MSLTINIIEMIILTVCLLSMILYSASLFIEFFIMFRKCV